MIEHDVPVPPGESTAIRRPASDGKTGEVNVAMAADGQTALDSLDGPRVGLLASEGGSIGRSLENRSASPETTPPVTPCSVVLTRSAELDAYAKSLADSAPNQLNDNAGLKVSPAVEVDLTLTDEEEETADITLQLVPKQADQHLEDTDLNSPLTGAQVKRSRSGFSNRFRITHECCNVGLTIGMWPG